MLMPEAACLLWSSPSQPCINGNDYDTMHDVKTHVTTIWCQGRYLLYTDSRQTPPAYTFIQPLCITRSMVQHHSDFSKRRCWLMPVTAKSVLTRLCIAKCANYLRMWLVSHISGPDIKVRVNVFVR